MFCLSEEKDLLSQWRGYADDGKGIFIGFNGEFLDGICSLYTSPSKDPKATIFFDKVHYDKNIANDYINETGISNVEKCQTVDELKQCVFGAMAKLEKESPYFKNSSFAEEPLIAIFSKLSVFPVISIFSLFIKKEISPILEGK